MADFKNRVTTVYKADTSAASDAVKRLRGTERDAAKQRLDELNKHNDRLNKQIAVLAKVAVGVGAVVAAWKLGSASLKSYIENTNLANATAGLSIGRLTVATGRLVEQTDLMRHAAKLQAGAWKLNTEEQERVFRGAMAIRKEVGGELEPILQKLTMSLSKGVTEELKEFGVQAKDKQGVLRELDERFKSLGGNTEMAGDAAKRAGVRLADALDNAKTAMGRMVVAMTPLLEKLAKMVEHVAAFVGFLSGEEGPQRDFSQGGRFTPKVAGILGKLDRLGPDTPETSAIRKGLDKELREALAEAKVQRAQAEEQTREQAGITFTLTTINEVLAKRSKAIADAAKRTKAVRAPGLDAGDPLAALFASGQAFGGAAGGVLGAGAETARMFGRTTLGQDQFGAGAQAQQGVGAFHLQEGSAALQQLVTDLEALEAAKQAAVGERDKILEGIFGAPSEIDMQAQAIGRLGAVFDGVFNAAGAGFDALITGQKSFGDAFKEGVAESLRGIAVQSSVEALRYGAMAAGFAVAGAYPKAAEALTAAGLHAGVAVAAGAGARAMGAGQTGARSGAGAGSALGGGTRVGTGGGTGGDSDRSVVIALGSDFGMLPALEQRQMLGRAIRLGLHEQVSPHTFDR
jgi:hypothetical protein